MSNFIPVIETTQLHHHVKLLQNTSSVPQVTGNYFIIQKYDKVSRTVNSEGRMSPKFIICSSVYGNTHSYYVTSLSINQSLFANAIITRVNKKRNMAHNSPAKLATKLTERQTDVETKFLICTVFSFCADTHTHTVTYTDTCLSA